MCTHSVSHPHFICTFPLRDVQTSRTRMAQGVCSVFVISLHLTLSILMFHPPSLLFPHGHFNTTFPSASFVELHQTQKRGSSAPPHERRGVWLPGGSHALDRSRRTSAIRTTIASLTSRKPHARTLDCSVFKQCLKLLFRTFLMVISLFRNGARKKSLGKPLQDREKEGRRRFCDQCYRVDVKEKSTEQYQESFSSDSQRIPF